MKCPRCGNETNGVREGADEFCTSCGGVLGPASTPVGGPGFNVDDLSQFVVYFDHPSAPGIYSVRRIDGNRWVGIQIAAHKNRDAVIVAIPSTHVRADVPVEAPIVEVWIDKRIDAGAVQRMPL